MSFPHADFDARRAGLVQASAVMALGLGLLALAHTQPAWLGMRVGPGLFAQWAAKAVTLLGALMALLAAGGRLAGARMPRAASLAAGLVLLTGSAVFAAFARDIGLVLGCAVASAFTGWAAGERAPMAVLHAAAIGAIAALAIGYTLLPEAAPIWP
jgi:hypothetical protein